MNKVHIQRVLTVNNAAFLPDADADGEPAEIVFEDGVVIIRTRRALDGPEFLFEPEQFVAIAKFLHAEGMVVAGNGNSLQPPVTVPVPALLPVKDFMNLAGMLPTITANFPEPVGLAEYLAGSKYGPGEVPAEAEAEPEAEPECTPDFQPPRPEAGETGPGMETARHSLDDVDWLRHAYLDEMLSTPTIARMIGCSAGTVARALKQAGIPIRPMGGKGARRTTNDARYAAMLSTVLDGGEL